MPEVVLDCRSLSVSYPHADVVRDARFRVHGGECVAIVGPSGAGKSTILRALLGIADENCSVTGNATIGGINVVGAPEPAMRALRGGTVGFIGQDPYGAYDPLMSVRTNLAETWRVKGLRADHRSIEVSLSEMGIRRPSHQAARRPLAWSGGMLQRAQVVAATGLEPRLVMADEPTSALDDANGRRVLDALCDGSRAVLLVSHDLRLVQRYADRVLGLADGVLREIPLASDVSPPVSPCKPTPGDLLVVAQGLTRAYPGGGGLAATDLTLNRGVVYGIRGESGVGKSTLLRLLAGIEKPTSGSIARHAGQEVAMIHQNARASLNPRWSVSRAILEPQNPRLRDRHQVDVTTALRSVGLEVGLAKRPCRELSGGQAQRVAIARAALSAAPLVLADEPTAALDGVTAARTLQMLRELANPATGISPTAAADNGRAVVIVSHDDDLLDRYCDEICTLAYFDSVSAPG